MAPARYLAGVALSLPPTATVASLARGRGTSRRVLVNHHAVRIFPDRHAASGEKSPRPLDNARLARNSSHRNQP